MTLLRKIIFYLFFLIFVTCAPILVLYALGYGFNPKQSHPIVKTGLIYISTVPKNADVFLEGKKAKEKTPTVLNELISGKYEIQIMHEGYEPWVREITVKAGKASAFDRIILIPQKSRKETLLEQPFKELLPISGGEQLLLAESETIQDFWIFDWASEEGRRVNIASPLIPPDLEVKKIHWAFESPFVLFEMQEKNSLRYLGLDLKKNEITNLQALFSDDQKPERIAWSPEDESYIFSYQKGDLDRIDVTLKSVAPRFMKNVWGFGFLNRNIYILTRSGIFLESGLESQRHKLLLNDRVFFNQLLAETDFFEIYFLKKNIVLFLGNDGKLIGNRLPYHYADSGVRGIVLGENKRSALIYQKERLGILDFSQKEESGEVFEKAPRMAWIYEKGKNIRQIFWIYEDSHVLFVDGDEVYLMDLSAVAGQPSFLFKIKEGTQIFYSEKTGKVYYLAPETGHLLALEILPREEISFLPFPDIETRKLSKEIDG